MANGRKITLFNTKISKAEIHETTANTWGELKRELERLGKFTSDLTAMVKENKTNLEHEGAELPIGIGLNSRKELNGTDFTLFLMVSKNKSGNKLDYELVVDLVEKLEEDIQDIISLKIEEFLLKLNNEADELIANSPSEEDALAKEADELGI